MSKQTNDPTVLRLKGQIRELRRSGDHQNAGEHSYALACRCLRTGNKQQAYTFGQLSVELLGSSEKSEGHRAPINNTIEGVKIPDDLVHARVVRERLRALNL